MNRSTSGATTVALAALLLASCQGVSIGGQAAGSASASQRPIASQGIPSPLEIQEHALENGFRLLLVEDHSTPRVAANLWYRGGAMQEGNGEHGITHFLEHVIHQGTTTVGTTDFASELPILREINETEQELLAVRNRERNQLRERGVFFDELDWPTTPEMEQLRHRLYELEERDSQFRKFWAEYTLYRGHGGFSRHTDPVPASTEQEYMEISLALPSQYIELFFRLEADRMVNAVLRGWEAQRFTVLEQILNSQSNPQTRFNEAIDGATAMSHPVYQPDGGHLRDFGNFSRQRMFEIYDAYFVPNNATLVLVGDITIDRARALAERYFGARPARARATRQHGPRGGTDPWWNDPARVVGTPPTAGGPALPDPGRRTRGSADIRHHRRAAWRPPRHAGQQAHGRAPAGDIPERRLSSHSYLPVRLARRDQPRCHGRTRRRSSRH